MILWNNILEDYYKAVKGFYRLENFAEENKVPIIHKEVANYRTNG